MSVKHTYKKVALATSFLMLAGCGGGSKSDSPSDDIAKLTGVFLDSPVANIDYTTETQSGVTDADGMYEYVAGESVTFAIGDMTFPPVLAAGVVTPLDIADTDDPNDVEALNMIRLLQTLDKDGDPSNGIEITPEAKTVATPIDSFDIPEAEFAAAVDVLIENGGQDEQTTELVSSTEAVAHFEGTLEDNGVEFDSIEGSWHFTDGSAIFHFLPDGRYLASQWENASSQGGFEFGSYTLAEGKVTFNTRVNHDGDTLTCDQDKGVLCDGSDGIDPGMWEYSFNDQDQLVFSNEDGNFSFNKAALTDSPIDGLWESRSRTQLLYFTNGSTSGSGNSYNINYEPVLNAGGDIIRIGTYQLNDDNTELNLDIQRVYSNDGLDCSSDCDTVSAQVSVVNDQLVVLDPDTNSLLYFDPAFTGDAPAGTATLIAQKDYEVDAFRSENYGIETEDDFRTYIQTSDINESSANSFKATFNIDEAATKLVRAEADSSASLQLRLAVRYVDLAKNIKLEVNLRFRDFGNSPSARYFLIGCAGVDCDSEEITIASDPVPLDGDFTGDHVMEISYDESANSFVYSIDSVEVGRVPFTDFAGNEGVIAAGGYSFNQSHFDRVRFRLDVYDIVNESETGLLKVHMDEFSVGGEVYDDFTNGLDNRKWEYDAENR